MNPFVDHQGLPRVGGMLRNADVAEEHKLSILLPRKHHLTCLIIQKPHKYTLRSSIQTVRNYLRIRYWIFNNEQVIRNERRPIQDNDIEGAFHDYIEGIRLGICCMVSKAEHLELFRAAFE